MAKSTAVCVIREGIMIHPPLGKIAELDVLKSFSGEDKDEVGEGLFCSLRVCGFKAMQGDVVES